MNQFVSVAIDGPAGAGKSTLARKAAKELGYVYVDTGAIYRTVALYCGRRGVNTGDAQAVAGVLGDIHVEIRYADDGVQHMLLNGEDVSEEIRTPENSLRTSAVSAIPAVRTFLLERQRLMAETANVIMDGRDIGTVVLPHASVKIYLTASSQARAQRRYDELIAKGTQVSFASVLQDVEQRDYNDMNRASAPLRQAEDAVLLDTTQMNTDESLQALLQVIREGIAQ